jgi:phosphopentomutase
MTRAILVVMDSFGIGGAADAGRYGDEGANTLRHIAGSMPLSLPTLASLGLGKAAHLAAGFDPWPNATLASTAAWGAGQEISHGKDTVSGHWEIAGVPVTFDWGYFPNSIPTFPAILTDALIDRARLPGILGNKHASGTDIIAELGEEHVRSGKPIVYTSADSVIQIAAHEQAFGLERLYEVCRIARELSYPLNIGRVIARPFTGTSAADFTRTGNRKDYTVLPPSPTLFNVASEAGREVVALGKIGDIYAHSGTGREVKASGHPALWQLLLDEVPRLQPGGLLMINFVDFDMLYGHRRDPQGYGHALQAFDARLPELLALLQQGDLLIITADHGNDPTWRGTDHTRERVPILAVAPGTSPRAIGLRQTFSDIGQTIASHLALPALASGRAW